MRRVGDDLFFVAEILKLRKVSVSGGATINLSEERFVDGDSGGPGPMTSDGVTVWWSRNVSDVPRNRGSLTIFETPAAPGATRALVELQGVRLTGLVERGDALHEPRTRLPAGS